MHDHYYNDAIVLPNRKHFRLRIDQQIVGYMQMRSGKKIFYSKDNYWWTSNKIPYSAFDRSTEIFDVNRVMLFEHDVVILKKKENDKFTRRGWIVWNEACDQPVIKILEEYTEIVFENDPSNAPFSNDIKAISQLFQVT
ncbi:MAG: hypothetical protein KC713_00565 [Candidatus Omnitrophica bacterium]|nr:hypothetical protein [Candidatus Omnitrophota bacterium]